MTEDFMALIEALAERVKALEDELAEAQGTIDILREEMSDAQADIRRHSGYFEEIRCGEFCE